MNTDVHPDRQDLADFARGLVDDATATELELHVASCDTCCGVVAEVANDRLLDLAHDAFETLGPLDDTNSQPPFPVSANAAPPNATTRDIEPPVELAHHPRYRLLKPLGRGGMGTVFLAEHRLMKRIVALKVVNQQLLKNETAIARFRQEVEAAASLSHPNIVTAHDAEQAGDVHFLVMEFVEGTSLDRLVAESGPLPIDRACDFMVQAARGLQHAHERGMVHRDIKPQNLIVTSTSVVKVLDFGLAHLVGEISNDGGNLTKEHLVLGTPDFISPEQAENSRSVDARSDIYSLGCTLYFLLAARVPFPVDSSMLKLSSHHLVEPKSLSQLRPDTPAGLVAVIEKMMAKDPAHRFADALEVEAALAPFVQTPPPVAKKIAPHSPAEAPAMPAPLRRRTLVGAIVLVCVLLVAAGFAWWAGPGKPAMAPGAVGDDHEVYVLFLLAPDQLWFEDYGPVHTLLEQAGVNITVASSRRSITLDPRGGGDGVTVTADRLLDEVGPGQFDVIILCGGMVDAFCDSGPTATRVREILTNHLDDKMFVAAMCQGQKILARAGLLNGVPCAKPVNSDTWGAEGGVVWVEQQQVVKSGQIITAADGEYAREFAQEILELLGKT